MHGPDDQNMHQGAAGHAPGANVGFVSAVKRGFQRYGDFTGRASRAEFWWWALFYVVVTWIAEEVMGMTGVPILQIFQLGLLLPTLAVGARRLHDIDRPGWMQIVVYLPYLMFYTTISSAIYASQHDLVWLQDMLGPVYGVMFVVAGASAILALGVLYWWAKPSEPRINRHGPPPHQAALA